MGPDFNCPLDITLIIWSFTQTHPLADRCYLNDFNVILVGIDQFHHTVNNQALQLVDDLVATNNHLGRLASGVDEFALMDNSLFCSATVSKAERDIVIYGYT